jgi:hypothetical protein
VTPVLEVLATVLAVVTAVLGGVATAARRRIGVVHLVAVGLLELALLVQAAVAGAALAGGHRIPETATFVLYLVGIALVPVGGTIWALGEPTRWGGTVLAAAAVVAAVMVWRLAQLWTAGG